MKILVYSSAKTFGGHELMSLKGLEALLRFNHSLDIVCPKVNGALVLAVQQLEAKFPGQCRVHLISYHMRSLQIVWTWVNLILAVKLFKLIKRLQPERVLVLQGDMEQASEMALPALCARIPSVSYVPMVMSGRQRKIRFPLFRDILTYPLYKLFSRFIVIGHYFKNQALIRGARDVCVVQNCIDHAFNVNVISRRAIRERLGIKDSECLSGFVGRISYQQKGIDRLIKLVAENKAYFRFNRMLIVGSGPDEARLAADINEHGLTECIFVLPWNDDRVAYFDAMDVFLCVSRFEGVPLTILEALSRGVPVISTELSALIGQLPISFVEQECPTPEVARLLAGFNVRSVQDGAMPQPILEGFKQEQFQLEFVQAVVS